MRQLYFACAALALLSVPVSARELPPETPQPEWDIVVDAAISAMRRSFYDPDSMIIEWVSGFAWGYYKPLIGKRTFGWLTCGNVNARNRMGGYAGSQGFVVIHTPEGKTEVILGATPSSSTDTCYRGKVPINAELLAATAKPGDGSKLSVADEIAKLVALREQGAITDEEFAALKAKLLAE